MNLDALNKVAEAMVAPGRGILAADESTGHDHRSASTRSAWKTPRTNRRDYRELMFRATDAMKYISGVILFEETILQKAADGTPLVKVIEAAGSIPGIKVDEGVEQLPGFPGEGITKGLDGLSKRLPKYYEQARASRNGAR